MEKLWGMSRDFSFTPLPPHVPTSIINVPHQCGTLLTTDEPTLTNYIHPKSIVYIRVHSCCCPFYGFKLIGSDCVHHYNIIWSVFTPAKILSVIPSHLSPFLPGLATPDLSTVSIVLFSPECHVVGIL